MKKIQILVPQYKETEDTISFLLDSIENQLYIDKKDIGVIICSDGGEYILNQEFLDKYSYDIQYVICEHKGVSATRNSALNLSDAEYVMFCDADDGFISTIGIYSMMTSLDDNPEADMLSTKILVEGVVKDHPDFMFEDHNDTFIHGKMYRRKFLIDNNLFFDERLKVHEDSYFCNLLKIYRKKIIYNNNAFYCWKKNPESISRQKYYIIKTMWRLLLTNDSLVRCMENLKSTDKAICETVTDVIIQFYLELQNDDWYIEENLPYLEKTYGVLNWFIERNRKYFNLATNNIFKTILNRHRTTGEHYRKVEWFTLTDFLKKIDGYEEYKNEMGDPYLE